MPFSRYTASQLTLVLTLTAGLSACSRQASIDDLADARTDTDSSSSGSSPSSSSHGDTDDPGVSGILPEAPTLHLGLSPIKQFDLSWTPGMGADYYRLLESSDGQQPYLQAGDDSFGLSTTLTVPLHARMNASYIVQACNDFGCTASEAVEVMGSIEDAVGYFKASNTDTADNFGQSVALSADGNTLAVGAAYEGDLPGEGVDFNSGAVYVFVPAGQGQWVQQAYIKTDSTEEEAMFGYSVALSGDGNTLAIGARDYAGFGVGGAFVFVRNQAGEWTEQAHLAASNADHFDEFGYSVALSGDGHTLAVGAIGEASNATGINGNQADNSLDQAGAAYVFARDGLGEWSQHAYIKASNPDKRDYFGCSMAMSADGSTLAVGAFWDDSDATGIDGDHTDNSADAAGAAYVFARNGQGEWSQQAFVKSSDTSPNHKFGTSLALSGSGDVLAVGAVGIKINAHGPGGTYVFVRDGFGQWAQQARFAGVAKGVALTADGNTLASGDDGTVTTFVRAGQGQWLEQARVEAPAPDVHDRFGESVAISADGDTLAVGAPWESSNATGVDGDQTDNSAKWAGAAYLY